MLCWWTEDSNSAGTSSEHCKMERIALPTFLRLNQNPTSRDIRNIINTHENTSHPGKLSRFCIETTRAAEGARLATPCRKCYICTLPCRFMFCSIARDIGGLTTKAACCLLGWCERSKCGGRHDNEGDEARLEDIGNSVWLPSHERMCESIRPGFEPIRTMNVQAGWHHLYQCQ